jgi:hypothetical protein
MQNQEEQKWFETLEEAQVCYPDLVKAAGGDGWGEDILLFLEDENVPD